MSAFGKLHQIEDYAELTEFVRLNYHALQRDFFGEHVDFLSIEDEFIDINRKEWLRAPLSPTAKAILLWFASVFERNSRYGKLNYICMLLRDDKRLFPILRSIFLYKHITRPSDYLERFDQILHHLEDVYDAPNIDARMRRLCENIAIEYLTKAIPRAGREYVRDKYLTSSGGSSLLSSARVSSVWHFSSLENELSDAADRVSESLFDEANDVLCRDLDLGKLASFPTNETCTAENVTCPGGLHRAKMLLAKRYAIAYAKTQTFCRQALTSESYTPFDTDDQCMRYMRQYMPLHMPQIEEAVMRSLLSHDFGGSRHIRILDVGAGPGTLYCVLVAMFGRGENVLSNYTFEYCPLEPSSVFADFFKIVGQNVKQKYVEIGRLYKCNLGDIDVKELQNFDWIFVGNAVTAMVASSTDEERVAMMIKNAIDRSRAVRPLLTIAENSGTYRFNQFCKMLVDLGSHIVLNKGDIECDGSWIGQCKFFVTRKSNHHPKLFLATYTR